MKAEVDRDLLIVRLCEKLAHLADQKEAEAMNLPKTDKDQRHYLQGMAQMARTIRTFLEGGLWI